LKKDKADNRDRGDRERDFISNRKKPELVERVFELEKLEV
jgi:hypothetical protein